jgi:hypothetical protein
MYVLAAEPESIGLGMSIESLILLPHYSYWRNAIGFGQRAPVPPERRQRGEKTKRRVRGEKISQVKKHGAVLENYLR